MGHRTRRVRLAILAVAIGTSVGACASGASEPITTKPVAAVADLTAARVVAGGLPPTGVYHDGVELRGLAAGPLRLIRQPSNELHGYSSPRLVVAPDRGLALYTTWVPTQAVDRNASFSDQAIQPGTSLGVPEVRAVDLKSGRDTLLERGAYSTAISASGRVAYVKRVQDEFTADDDFLGRLVVRDSLTGPSVTWSAEPARYDVVAWAGESLLAYRYEGEARSLIALDRAGAVRPLGSGQLLGALSSDGAMAVLVGQDFLGPDADRKAVAITLMRISDGAVLDTIAAGAVMATGSFGPLAGGEWNGDSILLPAHNGALRLTKSAAGNYDVSAIKLDRQDYPAGSFAVSATSSDAVRLWAPKSLPGARGRNSTRSFHVVTLDCGVGGLLCTESVGKDPLDAMPASNPSRPRS